jgi:hypothetical protein
MIFGKDGSPAAIDMAPATSPATSAIGSACRVSDCELTDTYIGVAAAALLRGSPSFVEDWPGLWGFPASSCEDKELMSDDGEIQRLTEIERITNGKPSYFDMESAMTCLRQLHQALL